MEGFSNKLCAANRASNREHAHHPSAPRSGTSLSGVHTLVCVDVSRSAVPVRSNLGVSVTDTQYSQPRIPRIIQASAATPGRDTRWLLPVDTRVTHARLAAGNSLACKMQSLTGNGMSHHGPCVNQGTSQVTILQDLKSRWICPSTGSPILRL